MSKAQDSMEQSGSRQELSEDGGSDDEVIVDQPEPGVEGAKGPPIVVVDLSEEEDPSQGFLDITSVGRRPRRSTTRVCYEEDSDEDEVQKEKTRKIMKTSSMDIEHLRYGLPRVHAKVSHLNILDKQIDSLNFTKLFDQYGPQIESLSFESMSLQMLQKIARSCPKLKILTLREHCNENRGMRETCEGSFIFKNLTKLAISGNSEFMKTEKNFNSLLASVPKGLEAIQYTFTSVEDASRILRRIKSSKNLRNLKSLVIEYTKRDNDDWEEITLGRKEINLITSLELKQLETLELNCGIWEDVSGHDLEALLSRFAPTLKNFTIAGNVNGMDLADKQLKFKVPKLPRLVSLSIGVVYEFDEERDTGESEDGSPSSSTVRQSHPPVISLDKTELISIEVELPLLPALESLSLGNLVNLKEMCPKKFPELKTLHVGSNWTMMLNLSSSEPGSSVAQAHFPVFPLVRDLQFPDCFQDEFFMEKIPEMFPVLRKVTMKLPSVRCLRRFFNVMPESRLTALHLMTSFDFEGMLETAISSRPSLPKAGKGSFASIPFMDERFAELKKFENPQDQGKVFLDFLRKKGVELPIPTNDPIISTPYGIGNLKELKSLVIGHIPRTIRIPTNNNLPHDHRAQKFHSFLKIGFREYPLSKRFFKEDLKQLQNLTEFRVAPNIRVSSEFKMWNLVSYKGQSGCNYKNKNPAYADPSDDEERESMWQAAAEMNNVGLPAGNSTNRKRKLRVSRQNVTNQLFKVKKEDPWDEPATSQVEVKTEDVKLEIKIEGIKKEFKTERIKQEG